MKKIKFKGKVVVCVRRENGKWEKGEENKGIIGFQIKPLSEFSLSPSFPFSLFLHILHLAKVIQICFMGMNDLCNYPWGLGSQINHPLETQGTPLCGGIAIATNCV
jgi:hypothetical protein